MIVFLDIDGTLTEVSSPWQDVHEYYGLWDSKGIPILEDWLAGNITYDEFCFRDVALWNEIGLDLNTLHSRFDTYPIRKEAKECLNALSRAGYSLVLLSSGFTYIGERVLAGWRETPKPQVVANRLYEEDGKLRVDVDVSGDLACERSKAGHVKRICRRIGVGVENAIAIGDGPSDKHMFDACGKSFLIKEGQDLLDVVAQLRAEANELQ